MKSNDQEKFLYMIFATQFLDLGKMKKLSEVVNYLRPLKVNLATLRRVVAEIGYPHIDDLPKQ